MSPQSPRAIEQQWMPLPGKALTSPCTPPHLNTWILLRFFHNSDQSKKEIRLQKGIQASFKGVGRTQKNVEKWIIVRGISLFSATAGKSSNLKTDLEKSTKKNGIYLQRMRGKSSLASYRSFQTINNNKKNTECNLSQLCEQPSSPQTTTLWRAAWFGESSRAQPSLQVLPTTPVLFPRKTQASITLPQSQQPPRWVLCQQPAEGLREIRTGSEHNESTQNNQPPAQVVTRDLLSHALQQPGSVSLPQMPPAHFQAHISFSHPPRGDDFHSLLPACRKKYLLLSLHTSSATSRSGMKKNLNSHSPSTLFMTVSMFITLLLNHPFSRVELSSVHPLCTRKVFSLSLITIFTAHPWTSSSFIILIRDREHIPDTAIHERLQQ